MWYICWQKIYIPALQRFQIEVPLGILSTCMLRILVPFKYFFPQEFTNMMSTIGEKIQKNFPSQGHVFHARASYLQSSISQRSFDSVLTYKMDFILISFSSFP